MSVKPRAEDLGITNNTLLFNPIYKKQLTKYIDFEFINNNAILKTTWYETDENGPFGICELPFEPLLKKYISSNTIQKFDINTLLIEDPIIDEKTGEEIFSFREIGIEDGSIITTISYLKSFNGNNSLLFTSGLGFVSKNTIDMYSYLTKIFSDRKNMFPEDYIKEIDGIEYWEHPDVSYYNQFYIWHKPLKAWVPISKLYKFKKETNEIPNVNTIFNTKNVKILENKIKIYQEYQ